MPQQPILIVGEICVDFTLATKNAPAKMRLGGVVHAARALWACGIDFAVAAVCPAYLADEAKRYLLQHGGTDFFLIGNVLGAPNVYLIDDVREVGHQGYENILRDVKTVEMFDFQDRVGSYSNVVIFPGAYDISILATSISNASKVTIDVAYDVETLETISGICGHATDIVISTSSDLFNRIGKDDLEALLKACKATGAKRLLLKENRGGSRLFDLAVAEVEELPAVLGETVNSVGVGDVYTAVFAGFKSDDRSESAWRGMQAATRYAQTTFPDDFRRDVQRDLKLKIKELRDLGGVILPWHERPNFHIYLAAPDFSYIEKPEIDTAISALEYHNFRVRRPIKENGEAERDMSPSALTQFYYKDLDLLRKCSLVFAVPLTRDPGTLVEIGVAIEHGIPVVTYDPRRENGNTMVICGSTTYSDDLDICINATYECLSQLRRRTK